MNAPPEYRPTESSKRWCVVGGGMLGMTLAFRLAQRGHAVTLLEASAHLGGLADAWTVGDITWDRHYHVTLLSDLHLRKLLDELGLTDELRWVETKTGFFCDGRLHPFSNAWDFLRFPPLGLWNKLRFGWSIFYTSKIRDGRRLEQQTAHAWLRRLAGETTFQKIWLPLLKAKLGDNHAHASAAFIWATIARLYAARRSGLKKEMFGYVAGGYRTTIARLEQRLRELGVEVRLRTPATHVAASSGQVVVEAGAGHETFDRAVLTVPSPLVAELCVDLTSAERAQHRAIDYLGIVCASLVLRRALSPYYVTNIADERVPFTGVIEMTALVNPQDFGGRHLIYLPWYVPSQSSAFGLSDDEVQRRFWHGLRLLHPDLTDDDLLAFRVSRVKQVMPIPTLDYSRRVPPVITSQPGVFVVNASQFINTTLNVNEAVRLAEAALPELLASRARSGLSHTPACVAGDA